MVPLPSLLTIAQAFADKLRVRLTAGKPNREHCTMATPRHSRDPLRPRLGRRRRDSRRAVVAFVVLCAVFLPLLFFAVSPVLVSKMQTAAQGRAQTDDNLATGSILLVPNYGSDCRRRLIDNATWRIWDDGIVDCHTALNDGGSPSASRVDVIREGFRNR
jgi:hypothetical protein